MKTLIISLLISVTAFAQTTIIYNPDGSTSMIIDNGNGNAQVWGTGSGYQGQIIDNGTSAQYWENGGGITTIIPEHPRKPITIDPEY